LNETIQSALNQTWPQKELLLVDDGSTDGSPDVAKKYESDHVKLFRQPNKGGSAARNKGLKEAKGEYIQFLDGDDLLGPNKIADQMAALDGKSDWLAISRTVNFYSEEGLPETHLMHNENIEYYDDPVKFALGMYYKAGIEKEHRGVVAIHSWLSPRALLDSVGPWNEELSVDDDGEYFCRVMMGAKGIVYVPDAVDYYRRYRTANNLSARRNEQGMRSRLRANELKYKHLKAATNDPAADRAMAKIFKETAVSFYPEYRDLYLIAMKHVKEAGGSNYTPRLGGPVTELIKILFGWRVAKLIALWSRNFSKNKQSN
jgi:glycosyltransferase involved in cell wall biosynthesis